MNLKGIRVFIRAKIQDCRLPRGNAQHAVGQPGNGQNCDACDEILTAARLMMEMTNNGTTFSVHGDCYLLWMNEQVAPTS